MGKYVSFCKTVTVITIPRTDVNPRNGSKLKPQAVRKRVLTRNQAIAKGLRDLELRYLKLEREQKEK